MGEDKSVRAHIVALITPTKVRYANWRGFPLLGKASPKLELANQIDHSARTGTILSLILS